MTTTLNIDFKKVAQRLLKIIVNNALTQMISTPNSYNGEKIKIWANMRLLVAVRGLKNFLSYITQHPRLDLNRINHLFKDLLVIKHKDFKAIK